MNTPPTAVLFKMGRPLQIMTADLIAAEQKLFLATGYNVTHRARILGIGRSTLDWHLVPVKPTQSRIPMAVQKLIDAGDAIHAMLSVTDEKTWAARLAWNKAKQAITKRKP